MVPSDKELEASPLVSRPFLSPKRLALILVSLLLLPPLVSHVAKPLWHRWNQREGAKLVREAEEAVLLERYQDASKLLAKALGKGNSNPEFLRPVAILLSKHFNSDAQALHFWRQLLETGAATLEDRMNMGLSLVNTDQLEEARKLLEASSASDSQTRNALELKSAILRKEGNVMEADQVLREACLKDPDREESMLTLASLDLNSPFEEVQKRALEVLWKLARGKGRISLAASDRIASQPAVTANEVDELLSIVESHKNVPERHRFVILSAYIRLHPSRKREVVLAETLRHEKQTLEEASDYLRWLDGLNEHSLIISLVPKDKAAKSSDLFVAYSNALASELRWAEVRELMNKSRGVSLPTIELAILNARCSKGLGESPASVRGRLQEASHQALSVRDVNGARKVAMAASSMGYDDMAVETYEKLAEFPQYRVPMLQLLLELQVKQAKSEAMLTTVRRILRERPNFEPMVRAEIYLELLLGTEMEVATRKIEELSANRPEGRSARSFLRAFAAMRRLDPAKALEYADGLNPSELVAGQRAVLSGIYRISGDQHRAFELAEKVPEQLLLKEEKQLMEHSL